MCRASSLAMLAAFSPLLIYRRWGEGPSGLVGTSLHSCTLSSHALPAQATYSLLAFPTQGLDKKRTLALVFSPVCLSNFSHSSC